MDTNNEARQFFFQCCLPVLAHLVVWQWGLWPVYGYWALLLGIPIGLQSLFHGVLMANGHFGNLEEMRIAAWISLPIALCIALLVRTTCLPPSETPALSKPATYAKVAQRHPKKRTLSFSGNSLSCS